MNSFNFFIGVYAKENIASNVKFGPLEGRMQVLTDEFKQPSKHIPDFKVGWFVSLVMVHWGFLISTTCI